MENKTLKIARIAMKKGDYVVDNGRNLTFYTGDERILKKVKTHNHIVSKEITQEDLDKVKAHMTYSEKKVSFFGENPVLLKKYTY